VHRYISSQNENRGTLVDRKIEMDRANRFLKRVVTLYIPLHVGFLAKALTFLLVMPARYDRGVAILHKYHHNYPQSKDVATINSGATKREEYQKNKSIDKHKPY
jgi:hypothetical protein